MPPHSLDGPVVTAAREALERGDASAVSASYVSERANRSWGGH